MDSSDILRLNEVKMVLQELLSHDKISGKPVLLVANKQDQEDALDEIDLIENLDLEMLVNENQCPTLVESSSITEISDKTKIDPGIRKGYHWLLNYIIRYIKPQCKKHCWLVAAKKVVNNMQVFQKVALRRLQKIIIC